MNEIMHQEDSLFEKITTLIDEARKRVKTTVNTTMVYTYYGVGHHIVEDEQHGEKRAGYAKGVLKRLSERLTERYGKGWSVSTLTNCRKFFLAYGKSYAVHTKSKKEIVCDAHDIPLFKLSWNHYQILMRIENADERKFYEIEAEKQNWDYRWLRRQYCSSLYERLALSRNKDEVMRLAHEGQTLERPDDVIKNPLALEFLGLREDESYSENNLENAIISKMKMFMLELGKGFLFEARQKRFTFDERHFFVDLVLYNRLLQCYVLIDLKTDDLTRQDLGQMQMYVNYYDRYVKQDFERPTIGILLCKRQSDALVELTLPKDANVYATAYQLYLPDKRLLQTKVKEWIEEFEENEELKNHNKKD